jgi:predicted GIY-YIG superfamily endonuclease
MPSRRSGKRKEAKVKKKMRKEKPALVYALQAADADHSYVGATNNFARRLRQHNDLLKGGARYTRRDSGWSPIFKVRGFPKRRQALQFEKLFHRGFRGRRLVTVPAGRTNPFGTGASARRAWALYWALQKERFSQRRGTTPTRKLRLTIEWSRADFYKIAVSKRLSQWGPAAVKHVLVHS